MAVATSENTSFGVHALRLARQKKNFFLAILRQFGLIQRVLGGMLLGENAVLHLENELSKSAQKKCRSQ